MFVVQCNEIPSRRDKQAEALAQSAPLPVAVIAKAFIGTGPHAEIAVGIGAEILVKAARAVRTSWVLRLGNDLAVSPAAIGNFLHFHDLR